MLVRRVMLVALAIVALAVPAGAAPAPQVTDECGDAGSNGTWNGDSLEVEENRPHLDIKSGGVSGVYGADGTFEGFKAAVTVCGAVSSSAGTYNIGWAYDEECYGNVAWTLAGRQLPEGTGLQGHIQMADAAEAVVTEECYRPESPTPLGVPGNSVETIYKVTLPAEAVTFNGDTVTFNVATSALPAVAAQRFVTGSTWSRVGVVSMEQGASLWAGYFDTEGNRGQLNLRTDFAIGGANYVVGEDATS